MLVFLNPKCNCWLEDIGYIIHNRLLGTYSISFECSLVESVYVPY